MKELHNPYAPPQTTVADIILENKNFQRVKIFSATGRIGRMRLLAYTFCSWASIFIALFSFALFIMLFIEYETIAFIRSNISVILLILFIPIIILNFIWCIQRSHDMNRSGWFSILIVLIPIIWIYWAVKPGTSSNNRFGPPPEPNNLGVNFLAGLGILIFFMYLIRILSALIRDLL
jgi:uncharacterized membrane protein YhaH (DUF805 family)